MSVSATPAPPHPHVVGLDRAEVRARAHDGRTHALAVGQTLDDWTLMAVLDTATPPVAVFEDFTRLDGSIVVVDGEGLLVRELPKSAEPTWADPATLYRGHDAATVLTSDDDILGAEILAQPGDPSYDDVAAVFPPIAKLADSTISAMETYSFVGTPGNPDKIGVAYGGRTANFDPAVHVPAIDTIRSQGKVLDGLVGGWLPALRMVYPEADGAWSEYVMYAPFRTDNGNPRIQPVWYRVARVEQGRLQWARYIDSYPPFTPRIDVDRADEYFTDLLAFAGRWEALLADGARIDVPDRRLADQVRHSVARAMMTRVDDFPKYGVMDRAYGGAEHDGFQDTLNVDVTAMLEWGHHDAARRYLDNYLTHFVRDDGSIVYRGPGTGQYGRMLTVIAQYYRYTRDAELLRRHRTRIDAIAQVLLQLRADALALPADDPAHGMLAGWSEADSCLETDPDRYLRPYLSNSSEAARGFADLGAVWREIGRRDGSTDLRDYGEALQFEAARLREDLWRAIDRSLITTVEPPCLPLIAGAPAPFLEAVLADKDDPQFRSYRGAVETLFSGNLPRSAVETIVRYRAAHRDLVLGVPMAYSFHRVDELGGNGSEMAGFLSYGHGYGLLQHDLVREFLLELYSLSAHQYTRGTWTAPETRSLNPTRPAAPYAVPAQLAVPLLLRWLLVVEEPEQDVLWLGKALPTDWLADGSTVTVERAPTRWGAVGFSTVSRLAEGRVDVTLDLPTGAPVPQTRLRLRLPAGHAITGARLDGAAVEVDAETSTLVLPAALAGRVEITVDVA
ncbi:hypothetical protein [Oerskovia turbata]